MIFEIVNKKYEDSIIIEGDNLEEIREIIYLEQEKRSWKTEDMYSRKID